MDIDLSVNLPREALLVLVYGITQVQPCYERYYKHPPKN
jgi:hypothetical protein